MKKFFLFAAAAVAALTVNAASFVGFDGHDPKLGTQIHDNGLIQNQVNITLTETDATKHKYEIKITNGSGEGEPTAECSFTMGGITFWYSNSNAGTVAYKTYDNYIQPNGNKRKVVIPTQVGEKVRVYAADAISGVAVEGASVASIDFPACYVKEGDKSVFVETAFVELTAKEKSIVLWSDKRDASFTATKFKLVAILPAEGSGIEDVNFESVKAVKRVVDGQVVIERDGRLFNLLGAEIK